MSLSLNNIFHPSGSMRHDLHPLLTVTKIETIYFSLEIASVGMSAGFNPKTPRVWGAVLQMEDRQYVGSLWGACGDKVNIVPTS